MTKVLALVCACDVLLAERLYSIGGTMDMGYIGYGLNSVEAVDIAETTDKWVGEPNMTIARQGPAVVSIDSKIYALGGYSYRVAFDSGEVLDTAHEDLGWQAFPRMTTVRMQHAAVTVNGSIYVLGGTDLENAGHVAYGLRSVDVISPSSSHLPAWTSFANMTQVRTPCLAVAVGSRIFAMGGVDANANFVSSIEMIDVADDKPNFQTLPITNDKLVTAVVAVGEMIFAMHNDTSISVLDVSKTPLTWETFPAKMLIARCFHGATSINQRIFVVGGRDCSKGFPFPALNTVEVLDLAASTPAWAHFASMSTKRPETAAVVV